MGPRQKVINIWRALFGDAARAFGTVSLVLLLLLAIAPAKNAFSEWRGYQNRYVKLLRTRAEGLTIERRFESGIHQIWIPEQGVVDRCTTCHVAMKETSLASVRTQPFRPHPPVPHSLEEFGCVTCHRGQGAATTEAEAHSSTRSWEEPLLAAKYVESSCGQCHLAPLAGTPRLNAGRRLLAREGCARCHAIGLPDGTRLQPADDPPPLTHIAEKTTREWIYAWIKNPKAYSQTATMPNFELSDADARDISAFLIAQSAVGPASSPAHAGPVSASAAAPDAAALQAGASLYGESFCASCHAVQNAAGNLVGGTLGPELTRVGTKVKPEWLERWIRNPGDYDPHTAMPHYRFTDQQAGVLRNFLLAKSDADFLGGVQLGPATPEQAEHGRRLVAENGCASCHEINGIKRSPNFAPDLSRIGSKALAQIAFAEGVPHTLPDYLNAKVEKPRAFGPGLKMPQFTLTGRERDEIVTALLSLTDRAQTQPARFRTASVQQSNYEPAGKAGQLIRDLRCLSCHAINGRGGDMAPDLTWEGTSVDRKWLVDFLKNPNTLRPALIRRMPKFNLSDAEINTLADYIMTVYQTPAFDRDMQASFTPADVEQGRQAFSRYACQSCHIVDPSKDKGYIGPTLSQAGLRLTPAWVFHWLKDPQALRPGTIEPNRGMSDQDARALTAFIMSLRGSPAGGKGAGR